MTISRFCLLISACLAIIACTSSQLTVSLNVVSDAAAAAAVTAPILAVSNVIPSASANLIVTYAGEISAAVVKVDAELATADSDAVKASTIVADFAAIVVPNIPGAPANAVALVNGIANAVTLFITQVQQQFAGTGAATPAAASSFFEKHKSWKASRADRNNLKKAVDTAKATLAKVASYKTTHK